MKKFVSIAAVVVLLLAAAIYYGSLNKRTGVPDGGVTPTPDPQPFMAQQPVAQDVTPLTKATANGTLKLTGAISHGYIAKDSVSELYATIDIEAIAHKNQQRPPLNVALVIDRSGSMAGEKMQYAKQAARRLVSMLDEQDHVAIVSYGSDVSVEVGSRVVSAMNREHMLNAIDRIEVSGGTNLSGGYERGLSEVRSSKDGRSINRVLLMSDGNANIGVTYLPDLERMSRTALGSGVSLSTIGVGLDYNEDLMARMANEGAGNYYFVDDSVSITQSFERELNGLTSSVARDTALVIKLAPGVSLKELYGFPYRQQGDAIMISLAEFHSEQKKNVLFKLNVPGDAQDKRAVLDVQLTYTDLVNGDKLAHHDVSVHSVATADAARLEQGIDRDVIARVQQIEVASSMQQAMDLYGEGKAEEAVKVMERQQARTRTARRKYDLKGGGFDRVDNEIDTMNSAMKAAPAASDSGRKMIKAKKARSNYIMFDDSAF